MQYARAATRLVASDRLPVCMARPTQIGEAETAQRGEKDGRKGIELWSLNVRGMSTREALGELEQEAMLSGNCL